MASNTRLIALNSGLALGMILLVWQGQERWNEAQAERRANLHVAVKKVTPPPMTPAQKPEGVQAAKYADVAAKNLFSKDRNPAVVVEPLKVEAPKVMPPLPVVYGVLGLPSGTKAIMAERSGGTSRSVRPGDVVGEFKILALDSHKVTFEWDNKPLEKNLDDLMDRSGGVQPGAQATSNGPAAPAAPPTVAPTSASMGADIGSPSAPAKACKAGDNSPVGTVVDGYRKTGVPSPFGLMGCSWVAVK